LAVRVTCSGERGKRICRVQNRATDTVECSVDIVVVDISVCACALHDEQNIVDSDSATLSRM
jgi:hypothetical protein